MNKTIALAAGFAVGCLLTFSPYASAEEEPPSKVVLESKYLPETGVDAQSGDLAISESKFSFEHEFKVQDRLPVTFSIMDKHTDINSDVAVFLPSNLVGRSIGLGAKFPAPFTSSENYFVGMDVFPSMYTDGWNESSASAFRIPFRTYLIYKRDENFIVVAGLSVRPSFDTTVLPVLGLIYRPNDQLSFNLASDNPNITYKLTDKTSILVEADLVNDEYEVTRNGEKGRVLFYREISTGAGVEHSFTENIKGLVSVGGVFGRTIKYEDDNGKVQPDSGMYVKARVTVGF